MKALKTYKVRRSESDSGREIKAHTLKEAIQEYLEWTWGRNISVINSDVLKYSYELTGDGVLNYVIVEFPRHNGEPCGPARVIMSCSTLAAAKNNRMDLRGETVMTRKWAEEVVAAWNEKYFS